MIGGEEAQWLRRQQIAAIRAALEWLAANPAEPAATSPETEDHP
jgi:hypothetical protein